MGGMFWSCILLTIAYFVTCWAVFAYPDAIKNINADVGVKHYAERLHILPLKVISHTMPFNTLITYVYSLVGLYWFMYSFFTLKGIKLPSDQSLGLTYLSVLSLMSLLYGPIHLLRIVKQAQPWAVLDQWFTLPFFGLVIHFMMSRVYPKQFNSHKSLAMFVSLSHVSYGAALLHPFGFDCALNETLTLNFLFSKPSQAVLGL